jgi:hypothetical protein
LDPRVVVLNFLEAVVAGPWSWMLNPEKKLRPLGTEVLIGEVREAIAFC